MSVYIRGMEMPTGNETITLFLYPDGEVVACGMLGPLGHYKAIPVPDHKGPLVDALEVIDTFPEKFIFTNEQARALTNYIIPADKEGV